MKVLLNTQNTNSYRSQNPVFKSKIFAIQTLQNIKDIPCACCGHKVISPSDVAHTFANVSKPLTEVLAKGFLDFWKNIPAVWGILNDFAQRYPKDSFDTIVQRSESDFQLIRSSVSAEVDNTYPDQHYIDNNTISKKVYQNMLYSTRTELDNSERVMNRFSQYKKYMEGPQLNAFEILQIYAQKYPDKRISEIINTPEIYNYLCALRDLNSKKRNEKLDFHFNNILKIIKSEDPLSVLCFKKVEQKARYLMVKEKDPIARMILVKKMYSNNLEFMKCTNVSQQIMDEISQFPDLTMDEYDFLAYAHENNLSDPVILKNILAPFMGSFEHIIPKSVSGNNSIYNGIVMCFACNRARDTRIYSKFLEYHPEMKKNSQKQINHVIKHILSGKIDDISISRWPIAVAENLSKYSKGLLNPELGDYCDSAINYLEDKYNAAEKEIEIYNNQISKIDDEKNKLKARIDLLDAKQKEMENAVQDLNHSNSSRLFDLNYLRRVSSDQIEDPLAHSHEKIHKKQSDNHQQFPDDFSCDGC